MSHRRDTPIRTILFPAAPPEPLRTYVSHVAGTTAIVRLWRDGDAARCGRCPAGECTYDAEDGLCLVHVATHVPGSLAASFSPASPPSRAGRDRGGATG